MFPAVSFAGSIEQDRMQQGIRQEQEEKQNQIKQQVEEFNKAVDEGYRQTDKKKERAVIKNIPEGYWWSHKTGKLYPIDKNE
jgi:hypothetical protein